MQPTRCSAVAALQGRKQGGHPAQPHMPARWPQARRPSSTATHACTQKNAHTSTHTHMHARMGVPAAAAAGAGLSQHIRVSAPAASMSLRYGCIRVAAKRRENASQAQPTIVPWHTSQPQMSQPRSPSRGRCNAAVAQADSRGGLPRGGSGTREEERGKGRLQARRAGKLRWHALQHENRRQTHIGSGCKGIVDAAVHTRQHKCGTHTSP